jgi:hypothetical protein
MMIGRTLALFLAGAATVAVASAPTTGNANVAASGPAAARDLVPPPGYMALQDLPYYPYSGKWTFARIWTNGGFRGFGRFGRRGGIGSSGGPGWSHDYPSAEINFSKILSELTYVNTLMEEYGGNVLHFDDPRLTQFPLAYVSEAGEWEVTPEEADALRNYLLKGGFVMFDDMRAEYMNTLAQNMKVVIPELDWILLDGTEGIFESFFEIDLDKILRSNDQLNYGEGQFYGLYLDNDKEKRMIAIANPNVDLGEHWEYSDTGWFPIDLSNEAYKVGVNIVVYAMTH